MSRQLAPSNSSIPPSSVAGKSEIQDEEEDYKSMWADISQHTVGKDDLHMQSLPPEELVDGDQDTEYSGMGLF